MPNGGVPGGLACALSIVGLPWARAIVGIPFAWRHVKLAGMALWPIGREIVPDEVAAAYRR